MSARHQFTIQSTRFPKTPKLNNDLICRQMIGSLYWRKISSNKTIRLCTIDSCYEIIVDYHLTGKSRAHNLKFKNSTSCISVNFKISSTVCTNQVVNSPAFPWTASSASHFRFYQHTSTLPWSGDTVCRHMNRPPYSGEKHVQVEGYQGTLRDEIGIRSSFYLFNE